MPNTIQKILVIMLLLFLAVIFAHSEQEALQTETAEMHHQHDISKLALAPQLVKIERGHFNISFQPILQSLLFARVLKPSFANKTANFSVNLFTTNNSPLSLFDALLI